MRNPSKTRLRIAALLFALLALPAMAGVAHAQEKTDRPIKGTIEVREGDDWRALAKITLEQARYAALEAVPGATFRKGELDEEDGYLVYDIELLLGGREVEVLIDAGDGSVLEIDPDDD